MALHGNVYINGEPIGRWSAQRITTEVSGNHTYRWEAVNDDGRRFTGTLRHQFDDGALVLARKVLQAAHAALAVDVADGPVRLDAEPKAREERPLAETQRMIRDGWVSLFVDRPPAEATFDGWLAQHDAQVLREFARDMGGLGDASGTFVIGKARDKAAMIEREASR